MLWLTKFSVLRVPLRRKVFRCARSWSPPRFWRRPSCRWRSSSGSPPSLETPRALARRRSSSRAAESEDGAAPRARLCLRLDGSRRHRCTTRHGPRRPLRRRHRPQRVAAGALRALQCCRVRRPPRRSGRAALAACASAPRRYGVHPSLVDCAGSRQSCECAPCCRCCVTPLRGAIARPIAAGRGCLG